MKEIKWKMCLWTSQRETLAVWNIKKTSHSQMGQSNILGIGFKAQTHTHAEIKITSVHQFPLFIRVGVFHVVAVWTVNNSKMLQNKSTNLQKKTKAGETESKRSESLLHFHGWLSGFGGGTVTPVGPVSASPRDSMSKGTWEGSPSLQHTLPRCTLHLSRTSAAATKGLKHWRNSWPVLDFVTVISCQKQQCQPVKQKDPVWTGLNSKLHRSKRMFLSVLRQKTPFVWPVSFKIIWLEKLYSCIHSTINITKQINADNFWGKAVLLISLSFFVL